MPWIGSDEALARLGVRPQTLYAYVSRGRIEARADAADPRRSLYSAADVERLAQRRVRGRRAEAVAHEAIAWGEPVLESAISTVAGGRLIYRGVDAAVMAQAATLEETAVLLWQADPAIFRDRAVRAAQAPSRGRRRRALFHALASAAATAHPVLGRAPGVLHREAAGIVQAMADAVAGQPGQSGEAAHLQVARGWGVEAPAAVEAIRRALVLLADHELNPSTFAARVTASTGASLASAVLAGLATLSGPLHGTAGLAVLALAREAEREGAAKTVRAWLAQGRHAPGFGHHLYRQIDPRAKALLEVLDPPPIYRDLATVVADTLGLEPNVDFVLAATAARYGWGDGAPFLLFALARSVGWIAHALEQSREGQLIRPRARYVGAAP